MLTTRASRRILRPLRALWLVAASVFLAFAVQQVTADLTLADCKDALKAENLDVNYGHEDTILQTNSASNFAWQLKMSRGFKNTAQGDQGWGASLDGSSVTVILENSGNPEVCSVQSIVGITQKFNPPKCLNAEQENPNGTQPAARVLTPKTEL